MTKIISYTVYGQQLSGYVLVGRGVTVVEGVRFMNGHRLTLAASGARPITIAVSTLIAAASAPAHAGPVQMPCGAGWCFDTVAPITSLSSTATSYLVPDMAAQFPGWTVVSGGSIPGAKIGIVQYSPYLNRSTAGVNIVARWNGALPANAAWIQIINSNYNLTGYSVDGGYHSSPIGPGYTQVNVDVPRGSASPNYLTAPPTLQDSPGRPLPTATNPVTTWTGQSFLVSESGNVVTVYGGIQWGFKSTYSPSPITMVTQTYTIADAYDGRLLRQRDRLGKLRLCLLLEWGRLQVRRPDRRRRTCRARPTPTISTMTATR